LTDQPLESGSGFPAIYTRAHQQRPIHRTASGPFSGDELCLKLLLVALFLPEGLSFFIGDFRLSVERVLLIILSISAMARFSQRMTTRNLVCVPADIIALAAGIWMILAAIATGGMTGLKGSGVLALEFTVTYYVFRYLLGPVDSSVRVITFACKLLIIVVGIALLDPLTGRLFTYEAVKALTGYAKANFDWATVNGGEIVYRGGAVRAMGPIEHSILFGTICVWFGILALCTFPSRVFGWSVAGIALIGVWFSGSRAPLGGYVIAFGLAMFASATKDFAARWKVLGLIGALAIGFIFLYSRSPISTLLRFSGIGAEAGWYRQGMWQAILPLVVHSPIFGIGVTDDWDWRSHSELAGGSVDAFWLRTAMMFGIPGSVLIFLTMVSAFWLGPIDKSHHLSHAERRLSVALGLVVATAVFVGFTVHFWGICWVLVGAFPGMRANLAEAAILRRRAARGQQARAAKYNNKNTLPIF
jgi:hypothetical protein